VIRRRVLLLLARGLAGLTAAALVPRLAVAVDPGQRVVRIGYVSQGTASSPIYFNTFRERLEQLGYVEGKNLVIEARWAEGHTDRLPALMAELVEHKVDVIVTGATPGAIAAKNATRTIPIVAVTMADPVRTGLAVSLARPGGNLTGTSMGYSEELGGKWLELLQETVPRLATVAVIANLDNPPLRYLTEDVRTAASKRRLKILPILVREAGALEPAFIQARQNAQGILLFGDAVTLANQGRVASLAAKTRLPVVYNVRTFVDQGGLMAYAPDIEIQYRRAADYVDKILRGASPADLPIEQPTRYVLVVNLNTAQALGLRIPQSILLQADEVIR